MIITIFVKRICEKKGQIIHMLRTIVHIYHANLKCSSDTIICILYEIFVYNI